MAEGLFNRNPPDDNLDYQKSPRSIPYEGHGPTSPRFYKHGKRWVIENQASNRELLIDHPRMDEVVFMFNCSNTLLRINGKLNIITMETCTNSQILFDSVISAVEVINCRRTEVQVMKCCGTIRVDNTEDCRIFLSKDSLDCEVVTSKSAEINVLIPQENGDMVEYAIPMQYKTVVDKCRRGLKTTAIENA